MVGSRVVAMEAFADTETGPSLSRHEHFDGRSLVTTFYTYPQPTPTTLAAVVLANKTARIVVWAVMMREEGYQRWNTIIRPINRVRVVTRKAALVGQAQLENTQLCRTLDFLHVVLEKDQQSSAVLCPPKNSEAGV
jgi:hypothetical protein